jgi:hypothetical protein
VQTKKKTFSQYEQFIHILLTQLPISSSIFLTPTSISQKAGDNVL